MRRSNYGSIYDLTVGELLGILEDHLDLRPEVIIDADRLLFFKNGEFYAPDRDRPEAQWRIAAPSHFAFLNMDLRLRMTPQRLDFNATAARPVVTVWRGNRAPRNMLCDLVLWRDRYRQRADFATYYTRRKKRKGEASVDFAFENGKTYGLDVQFHGVPGKVRTAVYDEHQTLLTEHVLNVPRHGVPIRFSPMFVGMGGETKTRSGTKLHSPLRDWKLEDLEIEFYGGSIVKQ